MRAIRALKGIVDEKFDNITDKIFYQKFYIDLATARTEREVPMKGDFIYVRSLTGTLSIRLNSENAPLHSCVNNEKIYTPFEKFYLTNTAQAGKSVTLEIGGDAAFEIDLAAVSTALTNIAGSAINPATEDTIATLIPYSSSPIIYTVNIATASRELDYSQALVANFKKILVKSRTDNSFSMSWASGSFASGDYITIPAGSTYYDDNLKVASKTIRLGSTTANNRIEIQVWV